MPIEKMLLFPWLITLVTETLVVVIWGHRRPKDLGVLALINTITNLSMNLTLLILRLYIPYPALRPVWWGMEGVIFLLEAWLLRVFIPDCRHPFWLSLTMNAASLTFGMLLMG